MADDGSGERDVDSSRTRALLVGVGVTGAFSSLLTPMRSTLRSAILLGTLVAFLAIAVLGRRRAVSRQGFVRENLSLLLLLPRSLRCSQLATRASSEGWRWGQPYSVGSSVDAMTPRTTERCPLTPGLGHRRGLTTVSART